MQSAVNRYRPVITHTKRHGSQASSRSSISSFSLDDNTTRLKTFLQQLLSLILQCSLINCAKRKAVVGRYIFHRSLKKPLAKLHQDIGFRYKLVFSSQMMVYFSASFKVKGL